jgi:hypothetical protein
MNQTHEWQAIGYNLEAKLTEKKAILVRNQGQRSEHPHLIINIDDRNNIVGVKPSNSQAPLGSIEGILMILSQVNRLLYVS